MKNTTLIVIIILFSSCSITSPMKNYLQEEIAENSGKKLTSVLYDAKADTKTLLRIYSDINIMTSKPVAKSFNQKDFDDLRKKYSKETSTEFWNETDRDHFKFDTLVSVKNTYKGNKYNKQYIYYSLSKPILLNNKQIMLFYVSRSLSPKDGTSTFVVVMKKEKGKWIVVEKIYSQRVN